MLNLFAIVCLLGEMCACFLNWAVFLLGGGISGSSQLCKVLSQAAAGLPNLEEQSSSSHKVQFIHFLLWLLSEFYLRNLFLTQGYKDTLLMFPTRNLSFRSYTQVYDFELMSVHSEGLGSKFHLCVLEHPLSSQHLLKRRSFLGWTAFALCGKLSTFVWTCVQTIHSFPFMCLSTPNANTTLS